MKMIEMKSEAQVVMKIKKKTKAVFFKDVEVGDSLRFKTYLKNVGRSSHGTYASTVTVENLSKRTSDSSKSQSQIANILHNFELEEMPR
jgi:acyl-CoA hydrolase